MRCRVRSPRLRHERVYDRVQVNLLALRHHAVQHGLHLVLRKAHRADLADHLLRAQLLAALGGAPRWLRGRRRAVSTRRTRDSVLQGREVRGSAWPASSCKRTSAVVHKWRCAYSSGAAPMAAHLESWPLGWRSELPLKPRDIAMPDGGAGALAAGYPW